MTTSSSGDVRSKPMMQRMGLEPVSITDVESAGEFVDIHCHCLPGVDDGPPTLAEAIDLCRALVAGGVRIVVATPHLLGRYDLPGHLGRVGDAHAALRSEISRAGLGLTVCLAAEVRIDERIPTLLAQKKLLTLGHAGDHLLLELPDNAWVDPLPMIERLGSSGTRVIVAHPERYASVIAQPDRVRPWLQAGATLQVTAGSLCGDQGPAIAAAAWRLVRDGHVEHVAGDAHDARRRPPRMQQAFALLSDDLGDPIARRLCVLNSLRLVTGDQPRRGWRAAAVADAVEPRAGRANRGGPGEAAWPAARLPASPPPGNRWR